VIVAISRMRWAREPGPQAWEGGFWRSGSKAIASLPLCAARAMLLLGRGAVVEISPYSSLMRSIREGYLRERPADARLPAGVAGAGALCDTSISRVGNHTRLGRVIAAAAWEAASRSRFAYLALLPVALALMFVSAAAWSSRRIRNTILQSIVPDELRGRVAGFFMLAFLRHGALGNLAARRAGSVIGVPATSGQRRPRGHCGALVLARVAQVRALMRPTYGASHHPRRVVAAPWTRGHPRQPVDGVSILSLPRS